MQQNLYIFGGLSKGKNPPNMAKKSGLGIVLGDYIYNPHVDEVLCIHPYCNSTYYLLNTYIYIYLYTLYIVLNLCNNTYTLYDIIYLFTMSRLFHHPFASVDYFSCITTPPAALFC